MVKGFKLFNKGYMDSTTMRSTYNNDFCEFSIIYSKLSQELGCVRISLARAKNVNRSSV